MPTEQPGASETRGDVAMTLEVFVRRAMLNDLAHKAAHHAGRGPGGERGNGSDSSAAGSQPQTPTLRTSHSGPVNHQPKPALPQVS